MLKSASSVSRSRIAALTGALVASASFIGSASAIYTPVGPPASGEASTVQILDNTYGGIFTAQGENYVNGSGITAVRIEDSTPGGAPTNLINTSTGDRDDQLWSDGIAQGVAEARFAGYAQTFGYFDGWSGGTYHNLLDISGSGFNVTGSSVIDFGAALGTPAHWRWARSGDGGTWSSLQSDNSGDTDHMVTYMITGLNGPEYQDQTVWMLFWEDLNLGDADYNDMAVEVIAHAKPGAITDISQPVPEPTTAVLGLASLCGLGLSVARRRAAKR